MSKEKYTAPSKEVARKKAPMKKSLAEPFTTNMVTVNQPLKVLSMIEAQTRISGESIMPSIFFSRKDRKTASTAKNLDIKDGSPVTWRSIA